MSNEEPAFDPTLPDVTDSDPGGNTPHGLDGDLGISSERVGPLRGSSEEGTHGAGAAPDDGEPDDVPEKSPDPARGEEVQPDLPPRTRPSQSAPNPLGPGPDHEPDEGWRTQQ